MHVCRGSANNLRFALPAGERLVCVNWSGFVHVDNCRNKFTAEAVVLEKPPLLLEDHTMQLKAI